MICNRPSCESCSENNTRVAYASCKKCFTQQQKIQAALFQYSAWDSDLVDFFVTSFVDIGNQKTWSLLKETH